MGCGSGRPAHEARVAKAKKECSGAYQLLLEEALRRLEVLCKSLRLLTSQQDWDAKHYAVLVSDLRDDLSTASDDFLSPSVPTDATGTTAAAATEAASFDRIQILLGRLKFIEDCCCGAISEAHENALRWRAVDLGLGTDQARNMKTPELQRFIDDSLEALAETREVTGELDSQKQAAAAELERLRIERQLILQLLRECMTESEGFRTWETLKELETAKEKLLIYIDKARALGVHESPLPEAVYFLKQLNNELQDRKGAIRVFCRLRPPQADELCYEVRTDDLTLRLQKIEDKRSYEVFNFDGVFRPGTQEEIFADCQELIGTAVEEGYNLALFSYGQTNSGKTYTILGVKGDDGIAPRTIDEIFRHMGRRESTHRFQVSASILEVYQAAALDLLANRRKCDVRDDLKSGFYAEGLIEEICEDSRRLRELFKRGLKTRSIRATKMNPESSRSHLLFCITIVCTDTMTQNEVRSKIVICDLAGSERIKRSGVSGEAQAESMEINKSLSALGNVMEVLTTNTKKSLLGKPQAKVPYRDHILSKLMCGAFSGRSKVLMFVNCSPATCNLQETFSSLRYAHRAKNISCEDIETMRIQTGRPGLVTQSTVDSDSDVARIQQCKTSQIDPVSLDIGTDAGNQLPSPQAKVKKDTTAGQRRRSSKRLTGHSKVTTSTPSLVLSANSALLEPFEIDASLDIS